MDSSDVCENPNKFAACLLTCMASGSPTPESGLLCTSACAVLHCYERDTDDDDDD